MGDRAGVATLREMNDPVLPSPLAPGRVVLPSPLPMSVVVGPERVRGKSVVRLAIYTAQGCQVYYFDPTTAAGIAQLIEREARNARTGLVTANGAPPTP
jgi:hypothetical protein